MLNSINEVRSHHSPPLFVTVVVPAYNAHATLAACLQGLCEQTYEGARYEIIVVDNDSSPSLAPIVALFPQVIYEFESQTGSYAARNRALGRARGEVLAFTDADCIPEKDWIEQGIACLRQTPHCGLVGGRIDLTFGNPLAPTVAELCDQVTFGFQQKLYVEQRKFAALANAFTLRVIIEEIGPFDPTLKSSGDREWGYRVAEAGYQLVYCKAAAVNHPARTSIHELVTKARRLQGGRIDLERKKGRPVLLWIDSIARMLLISRLLLLPKSILETIKNLHSPSGTPIKLSPAKKGAVIAAYLLVRGIQELEIVRLMFGGYSNRG